MSMKGLELSRRFYEEHGRPMLRERFSHLWKKLAVGLVGSGSECLGYDDALSKDHDFEPGFCVFLPGEDVVDRKESFALERAYAKLPREFLGYTRSPLSPVGGNRHGVFRTAEFFREKVGTADGQLSYAQWLALPEQALAEATGGALFYDGYGEVSALRERLSTLPEDVRKKKLAGELLIMGQAGQYNYGRCVTRGEIDGAQMALYEFVKAALHAVFLLNRRYQPYYKWSFRALRELERLSELGGTMSYLLSHGNEGEEVPQKHAMVEEICAAIFEEARLQGLSDYEGSEAEGHAYAVNGRILDGQLRNLHILYGV